MSGLTDLILEDMPIHVYEGYLTTHSKTFSSILPLPPNISSTTSQRNHDKKGSHVRLHLVTMEVRYAVIC
nr:9142_t:CDS:2 [Entrophospora candida]